MCPFCSNTEISDRVLFETENFLVVKDKFPISKTHLLIISKQHYLSFGSMPQELTVEFNNIIVDLLGKYDPKDGIAILFERGNLRENTSENISIDHAHFHFILSKSSIINKLPQDSKTASIQNLKSYLSQTKTGYYFYSEQPENISLWGDSKFIESQFIRKWVGLKNNNEEWNWKK